MHYAVNINYIDSKVLLFERVLKTDLFDELLVYQTSYAIAIWYYIQSVV